MRSRNTSASRARSVEFDSGDVVVRTNGNVSGAILFEYDALDKISFKILGAFWVTAIDDGYESPQSLAPSVKTRSFP